MTGYVKNIVGNAGALMALSLLLLLSSCGGGGGSGGGSGSGAAIIGGRTLCTPDGSSCGPALPAGAATPLLRAGRSPMTAAQLRAAGHTDEYANSLGLDVVRATRDMYAGTGSYAATGAITGAGVRLGIVDFGPFWTDNNGFLVTHSELSSAAAVSRETGSPGIVSGSSHGTSVAGLMVARRGDGGIHGIAPGAQLYTHSLGSEGDCRRPCFYTPVTEAGLPGVGSQGVRALQSLITQNNGVLAINNSWGFEGLTGHHTERALRTHMSDFISLLAQRGVAEANRKILVWAAGNAQGRLFHTGNRVTVNAGIPELLPGLPLQISELRGHSLAVVSVHPGDGRISQFSNRCGQARSFCIAAPSEFTDLKFRTTSDDEVDNAVVLDCGTNCYATGGAGTSFAAPLVTGALALLQQRFPGLGNTELVARMLATATKTGIYSNTDIYGQGLLNVDAALTQPMAPISIRTGASLDGGASYAVADSSLSLSGVMSSLRGAAAGQEVEVYDSINTPFTLPLSSFLEDKEGDDALQRLLAARMLEGRLLHQDENSYTAFYQGVSVDGRQLYGSRFWFNAGSTNWWFANGPGAQRHFAEPAFAGIQGFTSPYNSMAEGGFAIGTGGQGFAGTVWQLESYIPGTSHHSLDSVDTVGVVASLAGGLSSVAPWRVSAGMLHEGSSVLASDGTGAFAGLDASTWHAGLELAHHKGSWSAWAAAHVGITRGSEATSGILQGVDSLHSSSWALGLVRRSVFTGDDSVSFRVVQSLRAERGSVKLRLPDRRDRSGNLYSRNESLSLKPGGREIDFAFGWQRNFKGGAFSVDTGITTEPDHIAGAPTRAWAGLAWRQQF